MSRLERYPFSWAERTLPGWPWTYRRLSSNRFLELKSLLLQRTMWNRLCSASGGPPRQMLPPRRSPRGKGVSPAIPRRPSGQVLEERPIPRNVVPAVPSSTTGRHNMNNPGGADRPWKGGNRNSHGWLLDSWRGQSGRSTMTVHGEELPDRG
jgi:hypothetical protein